MHWLIELATRVVPPLRTFIRLVCLAVWCSALWCGGAQAQGYSLRFYGHGTGDIDRVKIKIDAPAVPADVGRSFTIEFWMKAQLSENTSPDCVPGGVNWIVGNVIVDRDVFGDGDRGDFGVSLANGKIAFGVAKRSEAQTICGTTAVADGEWHHVAVTRNASTGVMAIFVDGVLDASGVGPRGNVSYRNRRPTSYPNSDPYLVLGAEKHDAGPSYPSYSGFLDEVRISKIVRYTTNFARPTAPFLSDRRTAALYHFDEGPAGPCTGAIADSAPRGRSVGMCSFGGSAPAGPEFATDVPPIYPTPPGPGSTNEWTQHAANAQRTSFQPDAVPTPWRWKWAWNGPNSSGQVRSGKFGLPRNSQPVTGGGRVYIAAGTRGVFALNEASGTEIWNFDPPAAINSTPAYDPDSGALFALSANGVLYKLDAATGSVLGSYSTGSASSLPLPPAIAGARVFVSMGNRVFAIDKHSLSVAWNYDAGSPVDTPPAYSPSRDLVVVASRDLYVHGIRNSDGTQAWRTKATPRLPGDPGANSNYAEVSYGWPVIAEQHGIVFIKLRLDWNTMWTWSPWPSTNAAMRANLSAQPNQQALLALDLDDGSTAFVPNVGHGGFGDGDYMPMGPMPVIATAGGQELAYVVMRGSPCFVSPCDGRADSRFGELVLDDTSIPGFVAGDVRFMENTFFPTDEQAYLAAAGNQVFGAHWMVGIAHEILDRGASRGQSATQPITVANLPHIVTSASNCGFSASHYCASGLVQDGDPRSFPPGFYIYYDEGPVYDQYWSEYAAWVISNNTVYFLSTDGALVALEHGSPTARLQPGLSEEESRPPRVALVSHGVFPHTAARELAGRVATIEGVVQEVFNNGKAVYLGFQRPHRGAFLVRIRKPDWGAFGGSPEKLYHKGDRIRVTGQIEWYQGDPVIYARSPAQIELVTPLILTQVESAMPR
ncbi:MAG: PQQ-binding-like beta-propeller repeat protein [Candidatus Binatia bacterium]|nr:PQQ-binding-like beta-propeller repeat protein [Candidatus Binatia bacterium]